MAERRMVSKVISISEKVNSMSLFGRLLYTWMIPHADDFGRMPGSPMKVRALVVPMGDETSKDVEAALSEMQERGLINWYEIAGEKYIQLTNFDEHQQGLHKRSLSKFPAPPSAGKNDEDAQYGERLSASEADIEEMVCDATEQNEFIDGDRIFQVERQVRVANSYLDIVATGDRQKYILEIKRQRLSNAALEQIIRYRELLGNNTRCLLIGYGLSANFDMNKAKEERVNVIVYDDSLTLEQLLLIDVNCREITLPIETKGNRTELNTTTTAHTRDCHSPLPEQDEPQTMMDAHHQVFGTNIIPSNHSKVLIPIMMRSGEAYAIELILEAGEAAKGGAPSIRYVQEIDVRWQKDRIKSREEAKSKKPQMSNRFDPNERKQTQNQLAKQKIREAEERDRIRSTQAVLPHRELI